MMRGKNEMCRGGLSFPQMLEQVVTRGLADERYFPNVEERFLAVRPGRGRMIGVTPASTAAKLRSETGQLLQSFTPRLLATRVMTARLEAAMLNSYNDVWLR